MGITKRKQGNSSDILCKVVDIDTPAICRLWAFRIIKSLRLVKALYEVLDLEQQPAFLDEPGNEIEHFTVAKLRRYIDEQLRLLEQPGKVLLPDLLAQNITRLGEMIGLSTVEQQLLAFAALIKADPTLIKVVSLMVPVRKAQFAKLLSQTLGLSEGTVIQALKKDSALLSSGLVALHTGPLMALEDAFEFVTYNFGNNLLEDNQDVSSLLKDVLLQAAAPTLKLTHYPHLKTDLQILLPYLKNAIEQKLPGVNVLIYGPPGTGKSELVRVLAQKLKLPLYEVTSEDADGDAINGVNRLRAYRMAQKFLVKSPNLLLFDETEDVFEQNPFSRHREPHKAWMNRMLEHNMVPCFWVTNDQSAIDDAFIRRFDQVIKLDVPPKAQRAALLLSAAPELLTAAEAEQLAEHPCLTPAVITRASRVVTSLNPRLKRTDKVAALQHLMQQTLRAQGFKVDNALKRDVLGGVYDPNLINADVNLADLTAGLIQAGSGRVCLYGAPGTGKTAYCHYLAKQLKKPLLVKTAGELLSMYLGETEKQIAAAFAEAKENDAVLLLDEVDSFLQDRRKAQHSWEVTSVNEMLVQMEAFQGVFVASTNLLHNLDHASLRRFDLKACFGYLKPEQTRQLFQAHCKQLKLVPCASSLAQLAATRELTPGDFAAIARQSKFRPFSKASDFAAALLNEVMLKNDDAPNPIGFLQ